MVDLKAEEGAFSGAAQRMHGIAGDIGTLGGAVERSIGDVHSAITHPALQGVLSTLVSRAKSAHQQLHDGVTALGNAAAGSALSYTEADSDLASRLKEIVQ